MSGCTNLVKSSKDLESFKNVLAEHNITDVQSARAFLTDSTLADIEVNKKLYKKLTRAYHPDMHKNKPQEEQDIFAKKYILVKQFLGNNGKKSFFPNGFNDVEDFSSCNKQAFDLWVRSFKSHDSDLQSKFNGLSFEQKTKLFSRVDRRGSQSDQDMVIKTKQYDAAIKKEYGADPFHDMEYGINRLKEKGLLPETFELTARKYATVKVSYSQPKCLNEYMELVKQHLRHYSDYKYVARETGVYGLKIQGVVSPVFKLNDCSVHYKELVQQHFPHNHANGMTMEKGMEKLKKHGLVSDSFKCPEVMTYEQCKEEYDTQKYIKESTSKAVLHYALPQECYQFDLAGESIVDNSDNL